MRPIDIVDVKAGINAGRLHVAVKGKYLLLGDYQTGESIRLSDIEVKPVVHAKWLYAQTEDGVKDIQCSNCQNIWSVSDDEEEKHHLVLDMTEDELIYCPICGARMDGGGNAVD